MSTAVTSSRSKRRKKGEVRPFDFRRQSKLSREHVRTMQIVQETFARGLSTMLASQLRSVDAGDDPVDRPALATTSTSATCPTRRC